MFGLRSPYDDVFEQFRRFEREVDSLLDPGSSLSGSRNIRAFASGSFPAVNVAATPEAVTVFVFAPGLDPKTLDVSIQQNMLSLAGTRDIGNREEGTYYRQERFTGAFRRIVSLPEDIDADTVDARYADGVVQITVNRRPTAQPRRIDIR